MKIHEDILSFLKNRMWADIFVNNTPMVIMFTAQWLGSCHIQRTIMDGVSQEFGGSVKFLNIDVEEIPIDLSKLGFSEVPVMLFTRGDNVFDALQGVQSRVTVSEKVRDLLVTHRLEVAASK